MSNKVSKGKSYATRVRILREVFYYVSLSYLKFFCTKSELSFEDYRRNVGRDHVNYGYSSVARNF
jgi:hypothetical protein